MNKVKKLVHLGLGTLLVLLGIAGLILPILNGVIPLLLGLILISFEIPSIETKLSAIAFKNQHIHILYGKLDTWLKKIFGR